MNEINEQGQKKNSGCGKKIAVGCLTVILLAAVGGFFAYRNVMSVVNRLSAEYTSDAPVSLPVVEVSDQEAAGLFARVDAFAQAVNAGPSGQELSLTSRDINVLIQKNPSWSPLSGKVYVSLEGDLIHGEASVPLEKLWSALKGRWLNGSATFRVETAAGRLLVYMDALTVRDRQVPEKFMAGIRSKNLAEEAAKNPNAVALIQKLDSVTVREGKLRIKAK